MRIRATAPAASIAQSRGRRLILWNTVYLERAVAALRRGQEIDEDLLAHIAPLGWNHINLTGDYVWGADKRIALGCSPPSTTSRAIARSSKRSTARAPASRRARTCLR